MTKTIHSIMTGHPATVFVADSVTSAYKKMKQMSIRHLPVVDAQGKLVGILSDRDFQRVMNRVRISETEETYEFDVKDTIESIMSWPVQSVAETTTVKNAARLMLQEKLSALVVTTFDHHPKGIITTDDFLAYVINLDEKTKDHTLSVFPHMNL
jgi:CBS domain-containing protein